jgi:hypothetical protein
VRVKASSLLKLAVWLPLTIVGVLHAAAIGATSDLPLAGRSDLDHLIALNGGVIPYPFENLVKLLDDNTLGARASGFIPDGRSLQRFETDFESPRVLLSHSEHYIGKPEHVKDAENLNDLLTRMPSSRTFLGYTPKANTIEVFSYNETLGRYEVQLIKNYGPGLTPRIEYTSRALCFSCHQNEGPIFPAFKWLETDDRKEIATRLNGSHSFGLRKDDQFISTKGAPTGNVLELDRAVRNAQYLLDFQKVWVNGCGDDPKLGAECRKLLLQIMLSDPRGREKPKALLERLDSVMKSTWPSKTVFLGDSEIRDRDPKELPRDQPLPRLLDPLTPRPNPSLATILKLSLRISSNTAQYRCTRIWRSSNKSTRTPRSCLKMIFGF